jgi:DKNYY family
MIQTKQNTLFSTDQPIWFRVLNVMILVPIIAWPLVAFLSCFMLDHPKDEAATLRWFYLTNAYPIYLLVLVWLNTKIFKINKRLGLIIPIVFIIGMIWSVVGVLAFFKINNEADSKAEKIAAERKKLGFIGSDDTYKVLEGKLYYKDTFVSTIDTASVVALADDFVKDSSTVYHTTKKIVDADAETFMTLRYHWQQDDKHIYKNGKIVPSVDVETFRPLNEYYAVDKLNAFYQTELIKGVIRQTFEIIEGTLNARDVRNCYRMGKTVDCKTLQQPR